MASETMMFQPRPLLKGWMIPLSQLVGKQRRSSVDVLEDQVSRIHQIDHTEVA